MPRILLIGGYGNAGRCIAKYLLQHTSDVIVILAGRQEEKARVAAQKLAANYPGRVEGRRVDLSDPGSIDAEFPAADWIVNAAGAVPHTQIFCEGLLRWKKNALDIQLAAPEKTQMLQTYAPRFREAGITYITDGGFHPGVPAVLLRYAAARFDVLEKGNVYSAMKIDWAGLDFAKETLQELLDEFRTNRLAIYQNGLWKDQSVMKVFEYDFGLPFGKQYCAPMFLPELEDLARQIPGLRETGFYVTGFNRVADYLVLPLITLGLRVLPRTADPLLTSFLQWGLRFGHPPYGIELVADCQGKCGEETAQIQLRLDHEDGYAMTAAPVVACLLQALSASIKHPGLYRQALIVDPDQFLEDIERMGIRASKKGSGLPAFSG